MERKTAKSHMDGVFVLLLTGVFAVCILLVLLSGGGSYRRLTQRDAAAYDRRICCDYVAAKVRHADRADAVWVGDFSGTPARQGDTLLLSEELNGTVYWTRVYWYDGWVRELFSSAEESFSPEDGEAVLEAESLDFTLEDGLLTVAAADSSGAPSERLLALRSGEGASS